MVKLAVISLGAERVILYVYTIYRLSVLAKTPINPPSLKSGIKYNNEPRRIEILMIMTYRQESPID